MSLYLFTTNKMKKKVIIHPRIYIRILEKKGSIVIAEYKSNQFNNSGQRTIKKSKLNLDQYLDNFSNDFKEILDKLNSQELNKTINYIKTQYKVLQHHIKNNNHDSIYTVKESIQVMENFKEELNTV